MTKHANIIQVNHPYYLNAHSEATGTPAQIEKFYQQTQAFVKQAENLARTLLEAGISGAALLAVQDALRKARNADDFARDLQEAIEQ